MAVTAESLLQLYYRKLVRPYIFIYRCGDVVKSAVTKKRRVSSGCALLDATEFLCESATRTNGMNFADSVVDDRMSLLGDLQSGLTQHH